MRPRPPASARKGDEEDKDDKAQEHMTVLPLHQRLQLIRRANNCSAEEARKILWQRTGEEGAADPWAHAEVVVSEKKEQEAASRPAESTEGRRKVAAEAVQACVVSVTGGKAGSVLMCVPGSGLRDFTFDAGLLSLSLSLFVYLVCCHATCFR